MKGMVVVAQVRLLLLPLPLPLLARVQGVVA
jgi:hypothetical protein